MKIDLASAERVIAGARAAALFQTDNGVLGDQFRPGEPAYSLENNHGSLIVFGGGVVQCDREGHAAGAVGISGGSVEQDEVVAQPAPRAS